MSFEGIVPVAAGIVVHKGDCVLLTQRTDKGTNPLKWEFPGGKLRSGESPEGCLSREVREELCIDIKVGEIFHVVNFSYPHACVLLMAYLCTWNGGQVRLQVHKEFQWVRWMDVLTYELADADRVVAEKLVHRWRSRPRWIEWALEGDGEG